MARSYKKAAGNTTWNPAKDSEGNKKSEPTDSDFIEGVYRGYTEKELKWGPARVHSILAEKVDGQDLSEEKLYDIVGNGVLDDELEGVYEGVPVYIQWKGMQKSKKGDTEYKVFDVYYDEEAQNKLMKEKAQGSAFKGAESSGGESGQAEEQAAQNPAQEEKSDNGESDDLPF